MADPITLAMIGAGVSGGTSLLQGKSLGKSLENAAIGGVLGGAGGALGGAMGGVGAGATAGGAAAGTAGTGAGAGLVGGANLTGAGLAAGTGAGTFAPAIGTVAPSMLGTPALNASLLTPGVASGLGATPSVYGGLGASSLLDKTGAFLTNNIGNTFTNMSTMDKLKLGATGLNALNQPQQQMIQPSQGQVSRPNFDSSSTLMNVGPTVLDTQENTLGAMDIMAGIPLTDEEKMRLQQLVQGYRG